MQRRKPQNKRNYAAINVTIVSEDELIQAHKVVNKSMKSFKPQSTKECNGKLAVKVTSNKTNHVNSNEEHLRFDKEDPQENVIVVEYGQDESVTKENLESFEKRPIFLHASATRSELPSHKRTMAYM